MCENRNNQIWIGIAEEPGGIKFPDTFEHQCTESVKLRIRPTLCFTIRQERVLA